jgi:hypothetical protein
MNCYVALEARIGFSKRSGSKDMRAGSSMTLVILLCATAYAPAMAVVPLTQTAAGSNSSSNTATKTAIRATANGSTTTAAGTPVAANNVFISKFDTTNGILVGARVSVTDVVTSVSSRVAATPAASGTGRSATASATGWKGTVSGAGFADITNAVAASSSRTCGPTAPQVACSSATSQATSGATTTLSGTRTVDTASLGAYGATDGGSVSLSRTADGATTIANTVRATNGTATSQFNFGGGTYEIAYDYLKFSQPSFEGNSQSTSASLDFGRIAAGSGPVTLNFTLYNVPDLAGSIHTADAGLNSITRATNASVFTTNASTFTSLSSGSSLTYSVSFNPILNGQYNDTFTFNFADYAPGGIGGKLTDLNLSVVGATVPEPEVWAMLIVGFGMVGSVSRSRKVTIAA